jgi:fatty acid desaturase
LPEEPRVEVVTGGSNGAPRSVLVVVLWVLVRLVVVVAAIWAIAFGVGKLPSDTVASDVILRVLIGLAVGAVLTFFVHRMLQTLAEAPPPPPQKVDARPAEIVYECPVCGTRVRLEVAATAKAPKHCGEEMEAKIG